MTEQSFDEILNELAESAEAWERKAFSQPTVTVSPAEWEILVAGIGAAGGNTDQVDDALVLKLRVRQGMTVYGMRVVRMPG